MAISSVDVLDGLQRALAEVARLVAVAQFDGFVLAGGGAGRHGRAAHAAVGEKDIGFHSRIAAGIENLSCYDFYDFVIGVLGRRSGIWLESQTS